MAESQERQLTFGPGGRILTNAGVWSPDGQWIAYDTRSDPAGAVFDGTRIERVHVETGRVELIYQSRHGACCGVATYHPQSDRVIFILGPENPTPDWAYSACHRQGAIVDASGGEPTNLDARDLTPPFTPGALRGGTHLHLWHPRGDWVCFTYEDHVLAQSERRAGPTTPPTGDVNQRNVGVSVPGAVRVKRDHPRNHDGGCFSVLVTRTRAVPRPGSDDITRACEEAWIGNDGYLRPDGTRQRRALAFQGSVTTPAGAIISEVFIVDLPEDLAVLGDGPLQGTERRLPAPPRGVVQRRLTFTANRQCPGIQGPRHWLRSSPDGSRIAFLMKDDAGVVQMWTVSPNGGEVMQLTRNRHSIASAFTWSPDGRLIAHAMDNSVCITDAATGATRRLIPRCDDATAPRPEACVFSPDGRRVAYVRRVPSPVEPANQVFVVSL